MAKWGEGDPRWIVEERADATNVNNWHWTERDATNWSMDKLRELLLLVKVEGPEGSCRITEVKLEGEASVNNRKAKLIYFYGFVVRASWLGTSKTGISCKGNIHIPNLSDENDMDELDVNVSLCKDDPAADALVALMRKEGVQRVRAALGQYVTQLQAEFAQGMILPSAKQGVGEPPSSKSPTMKVAKSDQPPMTSTTPVSPSSSAPCKTADAQIATGSFSLREVFLTSPDELYRALTKQEFVQAFTRSAAAVEGKQGGCFRILDGNVSGEFQELVPDKKIVMKWRFKTWPHDHHATISLFLEERHDETELRLECKGVPLGEEERTREGWKRYYFQAIKQTFGYGNRLMRPF